MEIELEKLDSQLSDNEIRMLEYETKEQDFLQFINQIRRDKDSPVTPDQPVPRTLQSKGIYCLLALTRLLEETVKMKSAEINSEKDLEDLIELRKQAERMGQTDPKHFHFHSLTHNLEGGNYSDDLSIGEDARIAGIPIRHTLEVEQHDPHKTKSLRIGTQMLSDTIGKVKTKFLKTSGTSRESLHSDNRRILPLTPNSGSGFGQRRVKANGLAGSNISQYTGENDFEKMAFGRRMSEAVRSSQSTSGSQQQPMDRFVSLPDNLEKMADTVIQREKNAMAPRKGVVSYKTSYDEAVYSTRVPVVSSIPDQNSKLNSIPSEDEVAPLITTRSDDYYKQLELSKTATNFVPISKEFAKKFERWVVKSKPDAKVTANDLKTRHPSNQSRVKGTKKKGKGFNRQRSMSADRAGLLAGESELDFEEKLRQWGIKQAHDPDYYLGSRRRSRKEERSVESPARLSRRDETTPSIRLEIAENTTVDEEVSSPSCRIHRPVSIERGRRVSPSRLKRYTSRASQGSHKSSSEGISSSNGSIEPINQLSPSGSMSGHQLGQLRTGSVESLLSTDESFDMEDESIPSKRSSRPLSMVALTGSLDSSEPLLPTNYVTQWSSDSGLTPSSSSRDVLRTINEDISKIRERKARRSDSSSETSLERSLERSFHHESTPKSSEERRYEVPRFSLSVEEHQSNLPSHSICVDSGLVMEENHFCYPELHPFPGQAGEEPLANSQICNEEELKPVKAFPKMDNQSLLTAKNERDKKPLLFIDQPAVKSKVTPEKSELTTKLQAVPSSELDLEVQPGSKPEQAIKPQSVLKSELSSKPQQGPKPEKAIKPQSVLKLELSSKPQQGPKSERVIESQSGPKSELAIESKSLLESARLLSSQNVLSKPDSQSKFDFEADSGHMFVKARLIKISSNTDIHSYESNSKLDSNKASSSIQIDTDIESMEETTQQLEPLLSSQTVSLRTKLLHLSSLYDYDDGEDLKEKREEPSGPYEVFKAPKKYQHIRSRSADGLLDSETEFQQFDQRPRTRSDMDEVIGFPERNDSSGSSTKTQSIASLLQVSPAALRKKSRSPGPVLGLVQRFDAHSSDSSPLISPTNAPTPSNPQMAKISERLMQNKSNKSHRYTVDLSRHVREIPKEGAVQRARSIFMDMQST